MFRAVYDEVQSEVVAEVVSAALAVPEPWTAVRAGLSAFLDACLRPSFRQVVVLDSVSLLQHRVWDGDEEPTELPMLRRILTPLVAAGALPDVDVDALVHVTLGGLYGAALFIARSPDPSAARADAEVVLDTLIGGLRANLAQATPDERPSTRRSSRRPVRA